VVNVPWVIVTPFTQVNESPRDHVAVLAVNAKTIAFIDLPAVVTVQLPLVALKLIERPLDQDIAATRVTLPYGLT
jgi:hypothetical protein